MNATTAVAIAAATTEWLTRVPITIRTAPTEVSMVWATARSRRVPPNDASTRLANPPNAVNVATCGDLITSSANANSAGTSTAARTARIAAAGDHSVRHQLTPSASPGSGRGEVSSARVGRPPARRTP
ncbi:hypothetical protein ACFQZ4_44650 [Catellatospora coxensis]